MVNPNVGFKIVTLLLHFHDLDHGIRCSSSERVLTAISGMMITLRRLRRAIRLDINIEAWIKGKGKE